MKKLFLLLFILLFPKIATAQVFPLFFNIGALPSTCNDLDVAYLLKSDDFKVYKCVSGSYTVVDDLPTTLSSIVAPIPSGMIAMIVTGTCPSGYSENTSLNGKMLRGTVVANGDVGLTGGNDSVTPTTSSISLTAVAQTFTGSSANTSAVSGGTPTGTNGTVNFTPVGTNGTSTVTPLGTIAWPAGVPTHTGITATFSGNALATHAHELPFQISTTTQIRQIASGTFGTGTSRAATAQQTTTANTTSAAVALSQAVTGGTPAGTVNITSQGTIAWPAGVPTLSGSSSTVGAQTFTGTQGTIPAQTFTGNALGTHLHALTATGTNGSSAVTGTVTLNAFDNKPSYLNVIFCTKT